MPSNRLPSLAQVLAHLTGFALAVVACNENGPTEPPLPDELSLAFVSDRDGTPDIYIMEDGGIRRLTSNATGESHLLWSPDGTRIAFSANGQIWVVNADGSGLTALSHPPATEPITGFPTRDFPMQWSPNGTRVLYTRVHFESAWVRVVNSNGTGDVLVAEDAEYPSWAQDGIKVALLIRNTSGSTWIRDVFVMNADGTGRTNLTNSLDIEGKPSWSPDGASIAFTRPIGIYTMKPDGSELTRLTSASSDHLVWSPDATHVAWSSGDCCPGQSMTELHVVDVAGTSRRLARVDGFIDRIAWAPTGEHIALSTGVDAPRALYVVNVNGSGLTRVGGAESDNHSPTWRAR